MRVEEYWRLRQGDAPHPAADYEPVQQQLGPSAGGPDGVGVGRTVSEQRKAGYTYSEGVCRAGWDVPDRKRQTKTAEQEEREAPKWFEHRFFMWLDRPRFVYPVYVLLTLAPFLSSLGSFFEMWPYHSRVRPI
jgi:hypothetical protein